MSSTKKTNARIQKWRTMLSTGLHKDPQLLHSRTRKGIPSQIRQVAWPQLVKLKRHIEQRSVQISYQKLINSLSNNVYEISLDIPRTFPEEEDSKVLRKSMNNVLKAIAIVHPKIGYCQGMNFLVLRLLQVLSDQQTFWLMDYLFLNDPYLCNNFINPKYFRIHHSIFQNLLSSVNPSLLTTLKQKSIHTQSYTMKCFMTLFSAVLKQQLFNRIFEVYLLEGWSIIYSVAIVLFLRHEKEFQKGGMEDIHLILSKKIFEIEDKDIDGLMETAYKLGINEGKVKSLERQINGVGTGVRNSLNSQLEIENRQKANKKMVKFLPQNQNIGALIFQNKAEQVNFDALYILKNRE